MLIWVCALHCEAKPVIDFYRLKKSHDVHPFDLYAGEDMLCVVSGSGKLASATACAWIAGAQARDTTCAWINLGTAGAADHEIGSLFALEQVIDATSGRRYFPAPGVACQLPGAGCITLEQASTDYDDRHLFDLEASGYLYSALRFSSAELVQSLKLISDNRGGQIGRKAQAVSDMIHANIETIAHYAATLAELEREVGALYPEGDGWRQLLALAQFSRTQQNRLRVLWRYLLLRNFDANALLQELHACDSSKTVLQTLEAKRRRDSVKL